jgi:hypothetical protein
VQSKLIAIAVLFALFIVPAAQGADEPVVCVQTYLAGAGYPVGKIDGKLGKRTIGLGNDFAAVYPELALPALNSINAARWCETLQSDAGRSVLASRPIPQGNAPAETIGDEGGLSFRHPLVAENFIGSDHLEHGFEASLWPGRVAVETDPSRRRGGDSSIRMHVLPGDCGWTTHRDGGEWNDCEHGNERVETTSRPTGAGEWYYGLSVMLDPNMYDLQPYANRWNRSEVNLFQWYQLDSGACFNLQFSAEQKSLGIDMRCWTGAYEPTQRKVVLPDLGPNKWYEFVVHANWAADDSGFFRVLLNGKMVMAYSGPTIVAKGRAGINDHPQIYAYGGLPDGKEAWWQYRTPITVWFDDMVRSTTLADIRSHYEFEDSALTDFASAIEVSDFTPAEELYFGDAELYADGETDRLPDGAIGPGGDIPRSIVSGFGSASRGMVTNSKGYGLTVAPDPGGGDAKTLRFEVRPGDCGKDAHGDWNDCDHGQEAVRVFTDTKMLDGEHYRLAWKVYIEGPRWPFSPGEVALMQLSQPAFEDQLFIAPNGLHFARGTTSPALLKLAVQMFDRWMEFEADIKWSDGKSGRFVLTMDGVKAVDHTGPTLVEGDARVSFGILRSGYKDINSVVYYKDVVLTKIEQAE